jgi:hypothetical protein
MLIKIVSYIFLYYTFSGVSASTKKRNSTEVISQALSADVQSIFLSNSNGSNIEPSTQKLLDEMDLEDINIDANDSHEGQASQRILKRLEWRVIYITFLYSKKAFFLLA